MSPILLRPVREQLEHDRVIRLLQAKYRRKFEVAINPGNEQTTPVTVGESPWYPDLVLQSAERGRKLMGVVEVETAESVNNLEAMSQWATFARLRTAFHLYIPAASIDSARRLCSDLQIPVGELWAYNALGDQMRFTLVQRARLAEEKPRPAAPLAAAAAIAPRRAAPPSRSRTASPSPARPARRGAAAPSARRKPAKTSGARAAGAKGSLRPARAQKRK